MQLATRVSPVPWSATALQPGSTAAVTESVNATVPVGALPATETLKITGRPESDGFGELVTVVVVTTSAFTFCTSTGLVTGLDVRGLPRYVAVMLWAPGANCVLRARLFFGSPDLGLETAQSLAVLSPRCQLSNRANFAGRDDFNNRAKVADAENAG